MGETPKRGEMRKSENVEGRKRSEWGNAKKEMEKKRKE